MDVAQSGGTHIGGVAMRLRMTPPWLRGAIFPLTIFSFVATGISYANVVFTSSARWLFLALLGVAIVRAGRAFSVMNNRFGLLVFIYCGWALLTSVWSIVPDLSLAKGIASIFTILIFTAAGRYWANGWTTVRPVYFLAPIALAGLASTFGGVTQSAGRGLELYQGITGNPNLLGLLVAASLPPVGFVMYRAFSQRSKTLLRILSVVAMLILLVLLWRSASRSALLCALCVVGFAGLALRASKMFVVALMAVNIVAITTIAVPEINDHMYERLILKNSAEGDIFFSRREPWRESMEGAIEGGWFGLGYGASFGDSEFDLGLTAFGYGREKGNSQLAILEEMGIVGAVIYALLVLTILVELVSGFRRAPTREMRMEMALLVGLVFGLLMQSVVEGWWTAPGSAESAIFWSTVGVASGLARRAARIRAELLADQQTRPSFQGGMPQRAKLRHQ